MKENILFKWYFIVLIIFSTVAYIGCEKKMDRAEEPKQDKVTADTNYTTSYLEEPKDTIVEIKIATPDLKGKWDGTFDGRSSVLNITDQTDSSFSGKITTNYRQTLNQEVRGTLKTTTREITMTDQLHSRNQGKYKGKLSADNKIFSGTFILDRDGSKYSFNLEKR